jgi:hypothetical protein
LGKSYITQAINIYLDNFAIVTKITNFLKSYFKIPATKVIGSPIIGNHEKRIVINPYLSK